MKRCLRLAMACASAVLTLEVEAARRALIIGIDDYTASGLRGEPGAGAVPGREWPDLPGPANDVHAMAEMLVLRYGFDRRDIVRLTGQAATRAAILQSLERHLVRPAEQGDVLLFYFAGHGSQVRNSDSDEPDKLDESLVPADSRLGAPDIRDKELGSFFSRILDRGARLTVILDNCHSGSGARGLATGARPRGVKVDPRDVRDPRNGPRPEERGALVLTASQDFDRAWDTRDPEGTLRGVFSWALLRAMRDASPGEPAQETFLRARARVTAETPYQMPVIAGNDAARRRPLLGARANRRTGDRAIVAIERVRPDGSVVLQGGWAHGLAVGTELRVGDAGGGTVFLMVTSIEGLARSEARPSSASRSLRAGALAEVIRWAAPSSRPLRVWIPRTEESFQTIETVARSLRARAAERNVRWIEDPTEETPTHLLRRIARGWEVLRPGGSIEHLVSDHAAFGAIAHLPRSAALFVQFPAPASITRSMSIDRHGVVPASDAREADFLLVGRFVDRRLTFAWVRPATDRSDRTSLPLRTEWTRDSDSLHEAVVKLRRLFAWQTLESPAASRSPYRLHVRDARSGAVVHEVVGNTHYELVLRATGTLPEHLAARYFYAFVIDHTGRGFLLFPQSGSVGNRFPSTEPPPREIALGHASAFAGAPPYGVDTYFLLTTDEPLPNPWILQWDGVRARRMPSHWSIERVAIESVPPRPVRQTR
ncbi:MAG: caspase family protein [Thermoanaerobaculia bacterium]